ncbi:copper-containing nitrite reductase [Xylariaceae sp. FL0662B]|nr:copper-containing nitrite reductase [Xylariaceae sp. FL0662B]
MSNLGLCLIKSGSLAPIAMTPAATRLPLLAAKRIISGSHRVSPPLLRQATRFPPVGTRSFSLKARLNDEVRKYRFLPVAFLAVGSIVLGIYVRQQSSPNPFMMNLIWKSSQEKKGQRKNDSAIVVESASGAKSFESIDDEQARGLQLPVEEAVLTCAPEVPPPLTRDHPVLLKVPLVTSTKLVQLTSQYKYDQWTFNGTVPGPFIRAREGDVVEITITNKDTSGNPHNIDCHAFTGPGGGAAVTTVEENETKVGRFKLLYPGLYVYHCAAAPVPVHIANGMYGLMYVQPKDGDVPPVDKEYYVMQSEFYHEPPEVSEDGHTSEKVEFSYPNGLREEPQLVAFNGKESALTRDHPLKALVGDSVRVFFGNAGPNLISSFHIIGTHFKNVYREGDVLSPPAKAVQTVTVPAGGSSIVDLKMVYPGTYTLVDHSIFRLDKGAVGFLNVSGEAIPGIYESTQPPRPCVGCKLHS